MITSPQSMEIQAWPIDKLIFYARNPRKNDAVVDRMCSSIREFGFKIPVLARSDGEVVDGHLRLKAARKLGISEVPVILCDEWTAAQVKAFRLLVNRSVAWADWDEELLALELQELNEADFDLSLTGFNPGEIDGLWRSRTRRKPTRCRPFPRLPPPEPAICGSAVSTECSAVIPRARRLWRDSWASASRC
jgi:ParB-like chromosome segregation protein Spo0J